MKALPRPDLYATTWRLPLLIWQGAFFVIPLIFMAAMSFWLVKNYRMEPALVLDNWQRMLGRGAFWDAYWITLWRAILAGVIASAIAFPASLFLAFRLSDNARRFALLCLIVPFFPSFLVRAYAWQVILAESGPVNAVLGGVGLGPFTMLNSGFGAMVGYLTLVLAALFTFIMTFGDFVSPFCLGGSKPPTLTILIIDTTKSGQQWPRAAVVAIMMKVPRIKPPSCPRNSPEPGSSAISRRPTARNGMRRSPKPS
jgi:spermidine/putrescine transport system permease protein